MERQSLVMPSIPDDLLLFLTTRIEKKAVWKCTFVSERLNTDQVFCTRCMLCLLQSWRFQLRALPGQTMQRAQNS